MFLPLLLSPQRVLESALVAALRCVLDTAITGLVSRWRIALPASAPPVRLTLGLHTGWAVEGAVGSEHKIDALYVSKHVDLAALLDEFAAEYGVPLVFSGDVYDLLSPELQAHCRWLDAVQIGVRASATSSSSSSSSPSLNDDDLQITSSNVADVFALPAMLAPVGAASSAASAVATPLREPRGTSRDDQAASSSSSTPSSSAAFASAASSSSSSVPEPRYLFLDLYTFDITADGLALARQRGMHARTGRAGGAGSDDSSVSSSRGELAGSESGAAAEGLASAFSRRLSLAFGGDKAASATSSREIELTSVSTASATTKAATTTSTPASLAAKYEIASPKSTRRRRKERRASEKHSAAAAASELEQIALSVMLEQVLVCRACCRGCTLRADVCRLGFLTLSSLSSL